MYLSEDDKTAVLAASDSRVSMRREARNQLLFLSAQFLLGMAVNLIGQPSQTTGAARAVSTVLLGLHAVVAIGLVAGAVMVIRAARGGADRPRQLARTGAVLIGLSAVARVMTMITKSNWWSYGMATGFIASVLLYGTLLVRAQGPVLRRRASDGPGRRTPEFSSPRSARSGCTWPLRGRRPGRSASMPRRRPGFAAARLIGQAGKSRWDQAERRDVQEWMAWLLGR